MRTVLVVKCKDMLAEMSIPDYIQCKLKVSVLRQRVTIVKKKNSFNFTYTKFCSVQNKQVKFKFIKTLYILGHYTPK